MPQTRSSSAQCGICKKAVLDTHIAFECGETGQPSVHWNHASCLERHHLLDGKIVVPLTKELNDYLEGKHFTYWCHICSNGGSSPLPFQLVEQGMLGVLEFPTFGISSPEIENYLMSKRARLSQGPSAGVPEGQLVTQQNETEVKTVITAPTASPLSNPQSVTPSADTSGNIIMQGMQNMMTLLQQQNHLFVAQLTKQLSDQQQLNQNQFQQFMQQQNQQFMQQLTQQMVTLNTGTNTLGTTASTSGTSRNNQAQASGNTPVGGYFKLPKMEVPIFSGDPLEWPTFWDAFNEIVHKHERFSNVEKMNFLLNHLDEEVKKVVKNFALVNENYPEVLDVLRKRFDDKTKVFDAHLNALMNLPALTSLNIKSLHEFSDSVDSCARALIRLSNGEVETVDTQCIAIVPLLYSKLPASLRVQLFDCEGKDVKRKLSVFRCALQQRVEVQEAVQEQTWANPTSTPSAKNEKPKGANQNLKKGSGACLIATEVKANAEDKTQKAAKQKHIWCTFCKAKNSHSSYECPNYCTWEQRTQQLGKDTCYLCLRKGHFKNDCRNKGKFACYTCKSHEHNSALCFKYLKGKQQENSNGTTFRGKANPAKLEQSKESESVERPHSSKSASEKSVVQKSNSSSDEVCQMCQGDEEVAMPTVVTTMRNPDTKKEVIVCAMLDTASRRTYVGQRVANLLGLDPRSTITHKVCTFGANQPKSVQIGLCDFEIQGVDGNFIGLSGGVVENEITGSIHLGKIPLSHRDNKTLKGLKLADPMFYKDRPFQLDLLIGNDYCPMLQNEGKMQLEKSGVYLLSTKLGWVPSGMVKGNPDKNSQGASVSLALIISHAEKHPVVLEEDAHFDLEKLWDFETIGIKETPGKELPHDDMVAFKRFSETVVVEEGRVSVQWLKKDAIEELPTNFPIALNRLKTSLKNLSKNPEYFEKYNQNFSDQLEKGVIEKVTPDMERGFQKHYIPHHAVITPLHNTTKMRVVYDASAKLNKASKSLNECLYRGPNLLADLCGLLLRFRLKEIALLADLEKAFLQVALQESERDLTRFLWLKDPSRQTIEDNLQIYRFCRVPFGFKTSPFLLTGAIHFLLDKFSDLESTVTEILRSDLYVDNLISGVCSVEEGKHFYQTAKQIFASVKMNLREWNSNSKELMSWIPETDRGPEKCAKVLGLKWDLSTDSFLIPCQDLEKFQKARTKREILACVASIFDPLNLVCCLKIQGMLFLQELWKENYSWDDEISENLVLKWKGTVSLLSQIRDVMIPRRCLETEMQGCKFDLLCFCDASLDAYSAVVYLRAESEVHDTSVHLVFTKARLTPSKRMTIPRAELMAVLIGTRCLHFVQKHLKIQIQNYYLWTDSQIVLSWLKNETHDHGVFVSNRISEILNFTNLKFAYVSSTENPADLASKKRDETFAINWQLWWHGPSWSCQSKEYWPPFVNFDPPEKLLENETILIAGGGSNFEKIEKLESLNASSESVNLVEVFDVPHYKSFVKLVRVSALVFRFIRNVGKRVLDKRNSPSVHPMRLRSHAKQTTCTGVLPLSDSEIHFAKVAWLKCVQVQHFPELFSEKFKTSALTQSLQLERNADGILQCQGRLGSSDLPPDAKFPILLPTHSEVTTLVVLSAHRILLHSGVMQTLAHVRNSFWIPKGRRMVTNILKRCMYCAKFRAKPFAHPKMPNLPEERVKQSPPFAYTGVDYFGPLYCKGPNKQEKVWVALFTCFSVRAVHLELVKDMSSESFICAFRRFVARRGKPKTMYSDNGTQFKLALKVLNQAEKLEIKPEIGNAFPKIEPMVRWVFIPQLSPWMGGVFERMVGLVKSTLRKALGRSVLTFDQLQTVLVESENIVNSRPLTHVSENVSDIEVKVLTPQNFLSCGHAENLPILPENDPNDPDYSPEFSNHSNLLANWKTGQFYLNRFWELWVDHYLKGLRERHCSDRFPKVKSQVFRAPTVGEVVIVKETNMPRNFWKLARVISLNVSKDNLVRSAVIKVAGSSNLLTRPITALYPLELTENSDSSVSNICCYACDPSTKVD